MVEKLPHMHIMAKTRPPHTKEGGGRGTQVINWAEGEENTNSAVWYGVEEKEKSKTTFLEMLRCLRRQEGDGCLFVTLAHEPGYSDDNGPDGLLWERCG